MRFLNVSVTGLRGRHHPALSNLVTTNDVKISRAHLKFLSGNYLTYEIKSAQSGGSPRCRICNSESESVSHVISSCPGLATERKKILQEIRTLCKLSKTNINFDEIVKSEDELCQFILDPTSLNLPERVSLSDPVMNDFYRLSRDYCFKIDKTRIRLLKDKVKERQ